MPKQCVFFLRVLLDNEDRCFRNQSIYFITYLYSYYSGLAVRMINNDSNFCLVGGAPTVTLLLVSDNTGFCSNCAFVSVVEIIFV